MKSFSNVVLVNQFTDEPFPMVKPTGEVVEGKSLSVVDAIIQFLSLGFKNPTPSMDDIYMGIRVLKVMKEAKRSDRTAIRLEDADYKWLVEQLKQRGPALFGFNLATILDSINDTEAQITNIGEGKKKARG